MSGFVPAGVCVPVVVYGFRPEIHTILSEILQPFVFVDENRSVSVPSIFSGEDLGMPSDNYRENYWVCPASKPLPHEICLELPLVEFVPLLE
jgi:hypothetical protein